MTKEKFNMKIKDYIHSPDLKREYNERHFGEAAKHYDFATRAMSLGRDRNWKRKLVDVLPDMSAPVCVDLACGTGDVSSLLAHRYPHGKVVGVDLTEEMLVWARKRHSAAVNLSFERGDMGQTSFEDGSVDIVTGSYAVRNSADLQEVFNEIWRILKPGGRLALLDFSKASNRWSQALQYRVLKYWCGLWGVLLHGNPEVHSYIAASLKVYPNRDVLHRLLAERGFDVVGSERFYLGTLELLLLEKAAG